MAVNLLTDTTLIQTPSIIVKIGQYEFGTFTKTKGYNQYPNYIESLEVTKINGQVNTYRLVLNYLITEYNDPNYFEKVFSSVATSRKIEFTYGDVSLPNYMYKNEQALITKISSSIDLDTAKIIYTVEAVSQAALANTGSYRFDARKNVKPSDVIYELLQKNSLYGLQDLFTGMRNITLCKQKGLIAQNDLEVDLELKLNITVLDYINYLVESMKATSDPNSVLKTSFYIMEFLDDTTDELGGTYFKIREVNTAIDHPEAYQLDIGYPNANCVFAFNVQKDENYSILYDYQTKLHPQEYVTRLNTNGEYSKVFAPIINLNRDYSLKMYESDKSWWSKMTKFPIKSSVKMKGLLRPSILMSYIRVNVLFFGKKHIYSGLYMISKQVDKIDGSGFSTTLDLIRIAGDDSQYIV